MHYNTHPRNRGTPMKSTVTSLLLICTAATATVLTAPTSNAAPTTSLREVSFTAATPGSCSDEIRPSQGDQPEMRVIACESVPANLIGDGLSLRIPGKGGNTHDFPFTVNIEALPYKGAIQKFAWTVRTDAGIAQSFGHAKNIDLSCDNVPESKAHGCIIGVDGLGTTQTHGINISSVRATITLRH